MSRPDPADPRLFVERELLKVAVQHPALAGPVFDELPESAFSDPAYAAVRATIGGAGGVAAATSGPDWVAALRDAAPDDAVRGLVTELAVEPPRSTEDGDPRYAASLTARLQEITLTRRIHDVSSRLQRLNPLENKQQYDKLFGDLIGLEQRRRGLREQAIGAL